MIGICLVLILGNKTKAAAGWGYTAWSDHGVVYSAPAGGSAYYPSVIYDTNGFGTGTPRYSMWYSDGNGSAFLVTSTNGVSWGAPTTMAGLVNIHHVQVLYDANCFGTIPCSVTTAKYRMWFQDIGAPTIYSISSMATAESADGINWINKSTATQNPAAKLVQDPDLGTGWNRGTYGPVSMFYQPNKTNAGTEPWNYRYVMYYDGTDGSHEDTGLAYSTDGIYWNAYTANPVLSGTHVGGSNAWNCGSATYGTVFKDSLGYHFFYSGRGQDDGAGGCSFPASFGGIGYASSIDGKTWVKDANPIFQISDGIAYRSERIYTPSVVNDGSGILRIYFSVKDAAGGPKKIGYATLMSPTSAKPFSVTENPAPVFSTLVPDQAYVVKDNINYKFYYAGNDFASINLAQSPDGITWTPYTGNPIITDAQYHADVKYYDIGFPGANSGTNPNGLTMNYRMWYQGLNGNDISGWRYAESPDGINWYNHIAITQHGTPVFSAATGTNYGIADVVYTPGGEGGDVNKTFRIYANVQWELAPYSGNELVVMAFSANGYDWTGYDPTSAGYATPIFEGTLHSGDFDSGHIGWFKVIKNSSAEWEAFYSGGVDTTFQNLNGIGYATSADGINWVRRQTLFTTNDSVAWRSKSVWMPSVTKTDTNTYKIWFLGSDNSDIGGSDWIQWKLGMADLTTAASPGATSSPLEGAGNRQGTITVVNTVINDNGGTKTVADFPLFINGMSVVSGIANYFPAPAGAYAVTETPDPLYESTFSGDCSSDGYVGISPGNAAICIITNNDIGVHMAAPSEPPLLDVIKVPTPLSLPNGPGVVKYTYTLRNIGTVPVTDITMVGDTCSPITLISGDTNGDAKLDVNETWIYRCSKRLSETHTNTVVATGWANGISATAIASSTVVVGSTVPPLIHVLINVTKTPSPLNLPIGGGLVTYTKEVTNPGNVPLSNIRLTDNKCLNIEYISGDTNKDSKLDPSETWTYTCQADLTQTTTNTVIASGEANGFTARDFAIATVPVALKPFSDVLSTNPNYEAINYIHAQNIVSGYTDGSFKPDSVINRAEFTKIIVSAKFNQTIIDSCVDKNSQENLSYLFFPDVTKTDWFSKYICVAKMNDVINGYLEGIFKPENNINFAEASKILVNAFGYKVSAAAIWYKPYVEKLAELNAIPNSIRSFSQKITRGEMAEMIYRLKANLTRQPSKTYKQLTIK